MNIRVDLNYHINDGTEVVFRSPVDCSQVTGLKVYYPFDGETASKEFAFADAHGNNVGDIDHLFAENVVVKVILDVTTGMAFVQNADTNAYLEGRFAELEKEIGVGISANQDIHAKYFTITDDGVLSLKPEYRGACPSSNSTFTYAISDNGVGAIGSKNAELPKHLVIPEIVDEIAVGSLAEGMFLQNTAVESLVLPDCVAELPERFCDRASKLKNIYGTEHIEKVGKCAFQITSLEKLKFPNLTSLGTQAFGSSPFLKYVDIGKITSIPDYAFTHNQTLSRVKGGEQVTAIGAGAFRSTSRLNKVDFLPNLTNIGANGFHFSRIVYDWASLENCTFGDKATSLQLNPTDIWSGCTVTPRENPLPTFLSQLDPRWADRYIGTSNKTYKSGCLWVAIMHAYCALKNLTLSTVEEFETIANQKDPTILNGLFTSKTTCVKPICEALGLKVTEYISYGQNELQAVYDAIADGKYVILNVPSPTNHTVLAYGVKENKEFLIADSYHGSASYVGKAELTLKYAMAYQNVTNTGILIHIISL